MTPVFSDSYDSDVLTPNHFLIGSQSSAPPITKTNVTDLTPLTMWRASQRLADMFWKRWTEEYLPSLIRSTKWRQDNKNIKIGDIVLIVDSNGPRNLWKKGRVEKLFPGKDGKVRVVDVRTTNGVYKRPVAKLCILDLQNNEDE